MTINATVYATGKGRICFHVATLAASVHLPRVLRWYNLKAHTRPVLLTLVECVKGFLRLDHPQRDKNTVFDQLGWDHSFELNEEYTWLRSLIEGCICANPQEPQHEIDLALEAIFKAFDGCAEAVEAVYRLGGQDAVVEHVHERGRRNNVTIYNALGYTWSFSCDARRNP